MRGSNGLDESLLGVSRNEIRLSGIDEMREICHQMASQARRELLLLGHLLEPQIYDQPPMIAAIRSLALSRPDISTRILVWDGRSTSASAPRIVALTQQLTSGIAIRVLDREMCDRVDAFLIADACGYVRRPLGDLMEGVADFNDPREAGGLRNDFNHIWDRSSPSADLRRLLI
jgi:hypothetical protein